MIHSINVLNIFCNAISRGAIDILSLKLQKSIQKFDFTVYTIKDSSSLDLLFLGLIIVLTYFFVWARTNIESLLTGLSVPSCIFSVYIRYVCIHRVNIICSVYVCYLSYTAFVFSWDYQHRLIIIITKTWFSVKCTYHTVVW